MYLKDWNLIKDEELTCTQKAILHNLKYRQLKSDDASCTISQKKLSKEVGRSRGTVNKELQALVKMGWIKIIKHKHPTNGHFFNEYQLIEGKFEYENGDTTLVKKVNIAEYDNETGVCSVAVHKDKGLKVNKDKIKDVTSSKPKTSSYNKNLVGKNITYNDNDCVPVRIWEYSKGITKRSLHYLLNDWKFEIIDGMKDVKLLNEIKTKDFTIANRMVDAIGHENTINIFNQIITEVDGFKYFISKTAKICAESITFPLYDYAYSAGNYVDEAYKTLYQKLGESALVELFEKHRLEEEEADPWIISSIRMYDRLVKSGAFYGGELKTTRVCEKSLSEQLKAANASLSLDKLRYIAVSKYYGSSSAGEL
ncbi:winged helix-turn-helix transcriptional regulator [Candidatus Nomurabacteria bacterium]|nr:winged helix-turn-helix transcriptional regulator [Candidatus Nomurabacteria bacterium]